MASMKNKRRGSFRINLGGGGEREEEDFGKTESNDSDWRADSYDSLTASISNSIASSSKAIRSITAVLKQHTRIRDDSDVFTSVLILITVIVASSCGLAAWVLHQAVKYAGCFGGVNGCHSHIIVDMLEPYGIGRSLFFILSSGLSGLLCSLILHCPWGDGVARRCKGGGSADTKIVISSGQVVNGWIVVLRILLAAIYMGGGNPLGTEGPIIHLSSSLATWLVSLTGRKRKKFLSTFGVIGATAGISAGFNVLVTGFVYVIEELTRTLSRKLALILAFAAGVAVLVKDMLEKFLEMFFHQGHAHLVPEHSTWEKLTDADINISILLCFPIGLLTGVAGWIFCHCAWSMNKFLNKLAQSERRYVPARLHLAIIGVLCGCLGAVGYEFTGMNAVWGTAVDAIPTAIHEHLSWQQVALLFAMKFISFILATAGGGPGGLLVPSLVTGGLLGITMALSIGGGENLQSACAVIGMGAMFASVMHLPVTGVIIIFELTRANNLILHIVLASFIASNVVARLPHGAHSYVHRQLAHNPLWLKLEQRDFIETDEHEVEADVAMFKTTFGFWLMTDAERLRKAFDAWTTGSKAKLLRAPTLHKFFDDFVDDGAEEPQSPKSPHSVRSKVTESRQVSPRSDNGLEVDEAARRRENKERWTKVSKIIPGLNWRIWKTLDVDQVVALTYAAEAMASREGLPSREVSRDTSHHETRQISEPSRESSPSHGPGAPPDEGSDLGQVSARSKESKHTARRPGNLNGKKPDFQFALPPIISPCSDSGRLDGFPLQAKTSNGCEPEPPLSPQHSGLPSSSPFPNERRAPIGVTFKSVEPMPCAAAGADSARKRPNLTATCNEKEHSENSEVIIEVPESVNYCPSSGLRHL